MTTDEIRQAYDEAMASLNDAAVARPTDMTRAAALGREGTLIVNSVVGQPSPEQAAAFRKWIGKVESLVGFELGPTMLVTAPVKEPSAVWGLVAGAVGAAAGVAIFGIILRRSGGR